MRRGALLWLAALTWPAIAGAQSPEPKPCAETGSRTAEPARPGQPCPSPPRGDQLTAFGVRAATTRLSAGTLRDDGFSVAFVSSSHTYATIDWQTLRTTSHFVLGGGSSGLEGDVALGFAGGVRIPTAAHQGVLFRAGARGHLGGNDLFYSSALELPLGQAGYQYANGDSLFEVALSVAPVLVGRFDVDEAPARKLGNSFAWGGHLALQLSGIHVEAEYARTEQGDAAAVDRLLVQLCGVARFVATCVEGRYLRSDVQSARDDRVVTANAAQLGILFGFGSTR